MKSIINQLKIHDYYTSDLYRKADSIRDDFMPNLLHMRDSIREELPDFGFRWRVDFESHRYELRFILDSATARKFNKTYLEELCELLPDQITTNSFKFRKAGVRYIEVPSRPCKCCGHVKNIKLHYLIFDIEKI